MEIEHDDRLECWNPADGAPVEPAPPKRAVEEHCDRHQTGLCAEAQADGVPCTDPSCRCEKCAHAQGARAVAIGRLKL